MTPIRQACLKRFRPIMMTTMAALLAALPLALGRGTGSELRQPLGYTMVGGLILSQALTLFTTPVIYLYLDEWGQQDAWAPRQQETARLPKPESGGSLVNGQALGPEPQVAIREKSCWSKTMNVSASSSSKACRKPENTIDHAGDGRDGMFMAASEPYDVIIMDRMLPGQIDGLAHHRSAAARRARPRRS